MSGHRSLSARLSERACQGPGLFTVIEPGSLLTPLALVHRRHGAGQDPVLEVLRQVVGVSIDGAVNIRSAINYRRLREVAVRRRRRRGPLQRIAVPGIPPCYLAPKQAVKEIENENQLDQPENQR